MDLAGKWTITILRADGGKTEKHLHALTIIDVGRGWTEIHSIPNKESSTISRIFDDEWLCRYPRPRRVIYDAGGEFTGNEFTELLDSYGIEKKPVTIKNPQGNTFVERIHLTMGDMLRIQEFEATENWQQQVHSIYQAIAWAIRSTVQSTTDYSPGQLVFSKDMLMQFQVNIDWEKMRLRRQRAVTANNQRENKNRIKHTYNIGDKVLIVLLPEEKQKRRKIDVQTHGPYTITKVYNEGLVKIQRKKYEEKIHIRRLVPYKERNE